jgi:hypothetical protein
MKRDQEDCTSPFTGKASRSAFLRRPSARPVVARVGSNRATPRVRVRAAARQSRPRSARRDDARTLTRSRSSRTTRHPGNSVNNTRIGHSPVGRRSLFCRSGHRGVARHQLDDLARIEQPVRARAQPSAHRSDVAGEFVVANQSGTVSLGRRRQSPPGCPITPWYDSRPRLGRLGVYVETEDSADNETADLASVPRGTVWRGAPGRLSSGYAMVVQVLAPSVLM